MGLLGGVGLLICGAVLYGITRAAARGSVPRNGLAGIRTGRTTASDAAWAAAHRAALSPTAVVSGVAAAFGIALIVAGAVSATDDPTAPVAVLFGIGYGVILAGGWWIVRVANRAAVEADPRAGE